MTFTRFSAPRIAFRLAVVPTVWAGLGTQQEMQETLPQAANGSKNQAMSMLREGPGTP